MYACIFQIGSGFFDGVCTLDRRPRLCLDPHHPPSLAQPRRLGVSQTPRSNLEARRHSHGSTATPAVKGATDQFSEMSASCCDCSAFLRLHTTMLFFSFTLRWLAGSSSGTGGVFTNSRSARRQ